MLIKIKFNYTGTSNLIVETKKTNEGKPLDKK